MRAEAGSTLRPHTEREDSLGEAGDASLQRIGPGDPDPSHLVPRTQVDPRNPAGGTGPQEAEGGFPGVSRGKGMVCSPQQPVHPGSRPGVGEKLPPPEGVVCFQNRKDPARVEPSVPWSELRGEESRGQENPGPGLKDRPHNRPPGTGLGARGC